MVAETSKTLIARVEHDLCVGVGMCVQHTPEGFDFDDEGQAVFRGDGDWTEDGLRRAADNCPMSAIRLGRVGAEGDTTWE